MSKNWMSAKNMQKWVTVVCCDSSLFCISKTEKGKNDFTYSMNGCCESVLVEKISDFRTELYFIMYVLPTYHKLEKKLKFV